MFWRHYLASFPFKTPFICGLDDLPDLFDKGLALALQDELALNLVGNTTRSVS